MKKIIAIVLCSVFLLTGCADENVDSVKIENTTFDLVSDHDTGIIYIRNRTHGPCYVYTPYYSKNGKLCKYDDGRIVEVEDGNDDN